MTSPPPAAANSQQHSASTAATTTNTTTNNNKSSQIKSSVPVKPSALSSKDSPSTTATKSSTPPTTTFTTTTTTTTNGQPQSNGGGPPSMSRNSSRNSVIPPAVPLNGASSAAGNSTATGSGGLPNGSALPGKPPGNSNSNIQFGSMGASAQSPKPSSRTSSTVDSLAANSAAAGAANPRVLSPQSSPSPIPQPPASGGRPPPTLHGQGNNSVSFGNFGGADASIRSASVSHSPLMSGPQTQHFRRDSSHSQHSDMNVHGIGPASARNSMSQQAGRGRGYGGPYQQGPGSSPGPNMRPGQPRSSSITSFQQQNRSFQQTFPNSPHQAHRQLHSPMPANAQLPHAQPGQMPMPGPHMVPGYGGYPNQPYGGGYPQYMAPQQGGYPVGISPEMMHQWQGLYGQHMGSPQSPRPSPYPGAPQTPFQPGQHGQPPNMSRTSSTISGTDRPASSTGKPPSAAPTMPSHASNASQASSGPAPKENFQKPKRSTGIVIKDPNSGEVVNLGKSAASPAPSSKSAASQPAAPTPPPAAATTTTVSAAPAAPATAKDGDTAHPRAETKPVVKLDGKDLREQLARQIKEKEEAEAKSQQQQSGESATKQTGETAVKASPAPAAVPVAPETKKELESTAISAVKADDKPKPTQPAPPVINEPPEFDEEEIARWEAEEIEKEKQQAEREAAYKKKKQAERDEQARKEAEAFNMADEEMKRAEREAEEVEERKERERAAGTAGGGDNEPDGSSVGLGTPGTRTPAPQETPERSGVATPSSEATPAGAAAGAGGAHDEAATASTRGKPSNLKLETRKPEESKEPSAAFLALRAAVKLTSLEIQYPTGIKAPLATLNTNAKEGRFRYDRDFLVQFRSAYTEKPSENWTEKLKETILDTGDSGSARAAPRSGGPGAMMGGRQPSNKGMPMLPQMGAFGQNNRTIPAGTTSEQRFKASTQAMAMANAGGRPSMQNPLAGYVSRPGGFPQPAQGLKMERTSSTTSLNHPNSPRNASQRGGSQRGGSRATRNDPKDNKAMPLTAGGNVKPIEITAGGWKPRSVGAASMAGPAPGGDNHMAPDVVQRKVKSALNKMTPQNFDRIADSILAIAHQSKDESDGRSLRQVIQLTFEKATDEAHWAEMYAQFCKRMLESMSPEIKDENILDKKGEVVVGGALFRKYLLTRCQTEFERGWKVNLPEKEEGQTEEAALLSDEYYAAAAAKRRGLGLVRFIGELYKLQMLTERIMHECVKKLVDYEGTPDEAEVESLTNLLKTIGAQLDASERGHSAMDAYFARITSMIGIKDLPSRLRFMLMDVMDLRTKHNWRPRNENAIKGPTTLNEVRAQAMEAERQKELQKLQENQRRGAGPGGRPPSGRGDARQFSGGGQYGGMPPPDYQRNTVGMDDLRRLGSKANSRQGSNAAPPSFGPTSMFASARGSNTRKPLNVASSANDSGASSRVSTPPTQKEKKDKEKEEAAKSGVNAFSVLANEGTEATSPGTSPALSKAQPANISEVASSAGNADKPAEGDNAS